MKNKHVSPQQQLALRQDIARSLRGSFQIEGIFISEEQARESLQRIPLRPEKSRR